VASTRDIRKGFTDHGCLLEWTSEAIDAFVVEDGGKLYITWKAYGLDPDKPIQILGRELSPDGLKVTGEVFTLLEAERDSWEAGGMEGQALFRRGDYFYLTYSGNACCGTGCNYQVGLARTRNLQGPWEKFAGNPVLRGNQDWKCPGHGTVVVTDDNRYFYLYHAYNGTSFTFTGREGLLSELVWDEQTGWPAFRDGSTPPVEAASPFGVPHKPDLHLTAEFNRREEPLPWVWDVSQPAPAFTVEKGYLRLETAKNSPPAGNFLGLVVKKGDYVFSATILPQDKVLQSICVYGDADNAMGAGLRKDSLEIWQVKKGERQVLQKHPLPKSSALVMLHLRSRAGRFYEFTWELPDGTRGTTGQEPLDGVFLPPWDRAPRVGISVRGEGKAKGMVDAVRLEYK
jgi:xylan 1,4-beta-xylosidase